MDKTSFISNVNRIRQEKPLVLNLTNYVVMNTTANALLALGASPIMSCSEGEMEDLISISKALVVNIGTLDAKFIELAHQAMKLAKDKGVPIVFDPVGSGASKLRTEVSRDLIKKHKPSVVRGNASEIMSLFNDEAKSKGVDSVLSPQQVHAIAKKMAEEFGVTFVISGDQDYVTNGKQSTILKNGDEIMSRVTGMGCTATAILGAFISVEESYNSIVQATALMGVVGEEAAKKSKGVGSMQMNFLDLLYSFSVNEIFEKINYEQI